MYAAQTSVAVEKSKVEIERLLNKAGATGFAYATEGERAMVGFKHSEVEFRIYLPLPKKEDFKMSPAGRRWRYTESAEMHWEQACRSHWRALCLIVKAKLEAISLGITTIEKEFAADLVMGDGRTLHQHMEQAKLDGKMPKALPYFAAETVEESVR